MSPRRLVITGGGSSDAFRSVAISAQSALLASTALTNVRAVTISAASTLSATTDVGGGNRSVVIAGAGTLSALADLTDARSVVFAGQGALAAAASYTPPSSASIAYNGSSLPGSFTNTTHTHTGVPFGTAASDRVVVVHINQNGANPSPNISSVTIGGISATVHQGTQGAGGGNNCRSSFAVASVPTGTSGDVVITFASSETRSALASYSLYGLNSATAVDFDSNVANPNPSLTIDTQAGGFAIAGFASRQTGVTSTWSGVSEDLDSTSWGSSSYPTSAGHASTASTSLAISVTPSTNNANQSLAAISFR